MADGNDSNLQDYEEQGTFQRSESDKKRRRFLRKHRRTLAQRRKRKARERGLMFHPPAGTTKLKNSQGCQFRGKVRYSYRVLNDFQDLVTEFLGVDRELINEFVVTECERTARELRARFYAVLLKAQAEATNITPAN